ncbi:MAG TPA: hypothetical protein VE931_06665 [Pyrinomonadaceae bacterium]|nr:hypothetical protein [Pyrinomonadaceae bacterium]
MTTQKQLSHLSFAAIILVFAALPALAQTGSVDNQTAVATTSTLVESGELAALRKDRVSIPTKKSPIVVAPVVTEKQQPSFSMTQFMKSATEPSVISDTTTFEFTSLERPRFNESSTKTINFVPSRGPKFPW